MNNLTSGQISAQTVTESVINFPNGITPTSIASGNMALYNASGLINDGNPLPVDILGGAININVGSGNLNVSVTSGTFSILNSGSLVSPNNPFPITFSGNLVAITYADTPVIDAFGRLRVSSPYTLFDDQNNYGADGLIFNYATNGSGSYSSLLNESAVNLTVGGNNNDLCVRQTKQYFRYQPGKSQLIMQTFVLGVAKEGVRKRIGYFDSYNGLFLEQIVSDVEGETGLRLVVRTNTSGSPVDTAYDSSTWNLDKMDGFGPSGIDLHAYNAQILFIDLEWLGVGRVRFGFVVDGNIYYCHEVKNANNIASVYMRTADLPVRAEIQNTSAGNADSLKVICTSVNSEGGFNKLGQPFGVGNGAGFKTVTTRQPVLSIKPNTTFNTLTNRMEYNITDITVFSQSNTAYYEVVYNGSLNSGNFTPVASGYSSMTYDVNSTLISGGVVIATGYAVAGGPGENAIGSDAAALVKLPLTVNYNATDADVLTVVATCTAASPKTSVVGAVFNWQEIK